MRTSTLPSAAKATARGRGRPRKPLLAFVRKRNRQAHDAARDARRLCDTRVSESRAAQPAPAARATRAAVAPEQAVALASRALTWGNRLVIAPSRAGRGRGVFVCCAAAWPNQYLAKETPSSER